MNTRQIGTSLTIGTFLITALTGTLLFFEYGTGAVRATHEWTSIALTAVSGLHIYVNRKPFFKYFKDRSKVLILAAGLFGAVLFGQAYNDIYSAEASYQLLVNSNVQNLALLFEQPNADLLKLLTNAGFEIPEGNMSIIAIADHNNADTHDIMELFFARYGIEGS